MKPEASTWCRANDHIFSIVRVGWLSIARVERLSNQSNRRAHAHRMGGPKLTTESGTRSAMQLVRRVHFTSWPRNAPMISTVLNAMRHSP
jgi:hypothetical protein